MLDGQCVPRAPRISRGHQYDDRTDSNQPQRIESIISDLVYQLHSAQSREQFLRSRGIVDDGQGAVYAFFNEQKAVYVGMTGSKFKSLLKEPSSPLAGAAWWPIWTHIRFLPLASASDRMILEDLLILSLEPIANQRPGAAAVRQFLTEMEGD